VCHRPDHGLIAALNYERSAPQQMSSSGTLDGHKVVMQLRQFDRNKFLLVSRGFHWVQEKPLNR